MDTFLRYGAFGGNIILLLIAIVGAAALYQDDLLDTASWIVAIVFVGVAVLNLGFLFRTRKLATDLREALIRPEPVETGTGQKLNKARQEMTEPLLRTSEFRVGSVLGRGISILFRNIVPFGFLSLLFTSPLYVYLLMVQQSLYSGALNSSIGVPIQVANYFLLILLTATLVYGTYQELRGRRASFGDCIGRGLALVFPVIFVAIVAGLLAGLATLLLIIPGLIVLTMLWVAIPAAVVERPGVSASLKRSRELTKGFRWQVFGIIVIVIVITLLAQMLIGTIGNLTATLLGQWAVAAFGGAFGAVASAVGYHDLRVVKEGVGIEQIAAVFD